jgi:hypothetical protein
MKLEWRIAIEFVEPWLKKYGITPDDLEDERPVWPTANGTVALRCEEIENLIAIEDPYIWAWLNLQERDSVVDEETREVYVTKGAPWNLFPVQARMARIKGNLIVCSGSEIGKTRQIVLGTLHEVDCWPGGANDLIAADSDITIAGIWDEIEYQCYKNPRIGGGVKDSGLKPFRFMEFQNGSRFEMRLCGFDGKQFRGGHFSPAIRVDEAAKWKNPAQWNELWRAGKPGSFFQIYSTPDGDFSSPFYSLCSRAVDIDGVAAGPLTRSRQSTRAPSALGRQGGPRTE